jgi:hypothetical protein
VAGAGAPLGNRSGFLLILALFIKEFNHKFQAAAKNFWIFGERPDSFYILWVMVPR